MKHILFASAASIACIASTACTNTSPDPDPMTPSGAVTTYQGAIRAIVEKRCLSCHVEGGIGPFALDGYTNAKNYAQIALQEIRARNMPPWLPSQECRSYFNDRTMPQSEIDLVGKWVDEGMIEGDPSTYVPPTNETGRALEPPTLVLQSPDPYTPNADLTDDYRCFVLPKSFDHETYLTGLAARPDRTESVHHVLLFLVPENSVPALDRLDAEAEGPGYTCFGGPGIGSPQTLGGWAPGGTGTQYAEGAAIRVPKGAKLVMQVHYNNLNAAPSPDQTEMQLWLTDVQPQYLIEVRPLAHLSIDIPAGEPASKQTRVFRNNSDRPWTFGGIAAHMHLLGTRITATAIARNGAETCLIDIPKWDFHWQGNYRFLPGEEVTIQPGGSIRLECTYDNSAAHQPFVNGQQVAPRQVTWGEGTLDEMCLAYIGTAEPYFPLPNFTDACPTFQACYDQCRLGGGPYGSPTVCSLQCASANGNDCSQCVVPAMGVCVVDDCPRELGAFAECLENCQASPDPMSCGSQNCQAQILTFNACAEPKITSGACNAGAAACGVRL